MSNLKQKILDLVINSFEGDRFLVSKFDKALDGILSDYPTCGIEQRLFLDEVEKKFKLLNGSDIDYPNGNSYLDHFDFQSDLSKVIKGE